MLLRCFCCMLFLSMPCACHNYQLSKWYLISHYFACLCEWVRERDFRYKKSLKSMTIKHSTSCVCVSFSLKKKTKTKKKQKKRNSFRLPESRKREIFTSWVCRCKTPFVLFCYVVVTHILFYLKLNWIQKRFTYQFRIGLYDWVYYRNYISVYE